ncbi:MAG: ISL3 family transposase [Phycisphaerae bacterium]|nr:ISL3 family transposase [Phycisphaerae bacterium]
MRIQTILNKVQKFQSFVYGEARLVDEFPRPALEVELRPRGNSLAVCSGCGCKRPGYDVLSVRRFEFVPFWGMLVFFLYARRRVDCPTCGVKAEALPWAEGKHRLTTTYAWFLAGWAKRLSWTEVAQAFHTSWHHVFESVKMAVEWGRRHVDLEAVTAIGIDEMQWSRGHHYVTVVYEITAGRRRLLWVGPKRTAKTLLGFFRWLGKERTKRIQFVCSDMWRAYLKVVAKKASQAIHVLDRFHIMSMMSKAIDKVRAEEAKELKARGLEPVLKGSRWWFLKRPEHLTARQAGNLKEVLKYNLRTVRSYLLKEGFQFFWEYVSPYWASRFLDRWCSRVMRSRIEPMKKVARSLRSHRELILNWFRARKAISAGVVEGLNNKAKLATRKAYGFRTYDALETVLYHTLGNLPEPDYAHAFL